MGDGIQRFLVPRRGLLRVRPSAGAEGRGFLRLTLDRADGARRVCAVPVEPGLPLLLRALDAPVAGSIGAGETAIEAVGWRAGALSLLRRTTFRQLRDMLRFDGLEIVPEGPRDKVKNYAKQIRASRDFGLGLDGEVVRAHPELIDGWPEAPLAVARNELAAGQRVAVALHLYYVELWPEVETLLARWRQPFTLFLTLARDNPELTRRVQAVFPDSVIRVVDNRGRDVRPFLLLLEEGIFDAFDLVCKIHGKKSLGGGRFALVGDVARRAAFLDLIATDRQARRVVQSFLENPGVGMVGPRRFRLAADNDPHSKLWGSNRRVVEALAARMGAAIDRQGFEFFAGTMFWARPRALEPLRRLRLAEESFAAEAGRVDGELEHAVERLFIHAAHVAGFGVEDVSADFEPANDGFSPIETDATASAPTAASER
jgi:lipopolysaccharide biosynthesis protein